MKKLTILLLLPFMQAAAQNETCGEPNYTIEGVFANSSSSSPILKNANTDGITVGEKGELSKYFEESMFGGIVNGWIDIGTVQVTAVKPNEITFKVLAKKSQVTVNGQDKSHFVAGKKIKFSQFSYKVPTLKVFYWEDNKSKKAEGLRICEVKTGEWKYYYQNGKLSGTEIYDDNGILNGITTDYYESGALKEKVPYKNDKANGEFERYYESGKLEVKGSFKEDQKHGKFFSYYENGNTYFETEFNAGVRIGNYKEWYENGNLSETGHFTSEGIKDGIWTFYREDGTIERSGSVANDIENGIWKYYNESGILDHEATYTEGAVTGPYKNYYPSGKIMSEGLVVNNKEEGEWKAYYESGALQNIANYKLGKFVGAYKIWYENGQLKEQGTYNESGNLEGVIVMFYENGKPLVKGQYVDGKESGKWMRWDEKGKKKVVKY